MSPRLHWAKAQPWSAARLYQLHRLCVVLQHVAFALVVHEPKNELGRSVAFGGEATPLHRFNVDLPFVRKPEKKIHGGRVVAPLVRRTRIPERICGHRRSKAQRQNDGSDGVLAHCKSNGGSSLVHAVGTHVRGNSPFPLVFNLYCLSSIESDYN